jgi:transposase-like protein
MSMARVVILAVVVEGRSKSEVARDYGVSRQWVQTLVRRYRLEGEAAFEPHSRRPHSSPHRIPVAVEDAIVALRKQLCEAGHDAGAARQTATPTIAGQRPADTQHAAHPNTPRADQS